MEKVEESKLFILDTNVLMHDPYALFRFQEHDVFLPMVVIEELDNSKKGLSEVSRNVRQTSRFLDELINKTTQDTLNDGLCFSNLEETMYHKNCPRPSGRIFLQTEIFSSNLPNQLPGNKVDNGIMSTSLALIKKHTDKQIILVTKDINLRIKAAMLGITAQDYFNDYAIDDLDLLHSGLNHLPQNFWEMHSKNLESWQESGNTYYKLTGPLINQWQPNQCIFHQQDEQRFEALVKQVEPEHVLIERSNDYTSKHNSVWGIRARNLEQNFALNLLMDPKIDIVTLLGAAGTGKTLLALAAGLTQTLEQKRYREIIMTRVTIPVGEDIGFLPGTEEEKMTPWMGALMDNLEVLTHSSNHNEWEQNATNDLLRSRIKIRSLNFMRGRTFLNKFIIIDEAQNLSAKQMQTLITRAGPGTKIICTGNLSQIDTPYLTETTSGLTNVIACFQTWQHSGHITLTKGERSRLADFASQQL